MKIQVLREPSRDGATYSAVLVDDKFFCNGLEDVIREQPGVPVEQWKIHGETAIPAGTYRVVLNHSYRFKRLMTQILDVPGFSGVRIHNGKGPESTEGCLLVSATSDFNYDRKAMLELEKKVAFCLSEGEEVTIEFVNPPASEEA